MNHDWKLVKEELPKLHENVTIMYGDENKPRFTKSYTDGESWYVIDSLTEIKDVISWKR